MEFPICSKDASSLAKRVSLLNFEPEVSKFPVIGTAMPFQSLLLRGNSFLFAIIEWETYWSQKWNFLKCSKDASKPAVSWLNFEPMVSKFPVIGTAVPFQSLLLRGKFLFVYHYRMGDVLELEMEFFDFHKDFWQSVNNLQGVPLPLKVEH